MAMTGDNIQPGQPCGPPTKRRTLTCGDQADQTETVDDFSWPIE